MLKELFCKHEYVPASGLVQVWGLSNTYPIKVYKVFVCKKCLKKKKVSL